MTNILIIEPSSSGLKLISTAKSMNLGVVVFNANKDERIIPEQYKKNIDKLIEIDTYNIDAQYHATKKINNDFAISAIIPGSEYHVPIASILSEKMNLPCVPSKYIDVLRIKSKTRDALKNKSIRNVRYVQIQNEHEIISASREIGFPCVIKPIASAGSIHVSRCNAFEELLHAYQSLSQDQWTELGKEIGQAALIEEYIDGEEFSVEGYIDNNDARIISITKKFLSKEPFFIEMGHIVSANLDEVKKNSIEAYIQNLIKTLKINLGIFHAEIKVDEQGPVLMEIAGRLPGCRIPDLIQLSKNINFYEVMIKSHLNWPIKINYIETKQYAGMCYFHLNNKHIFHRINGVDQLHTLPGFQEFTLLKNPGEFVPPLTDFQGRVAYCIFTASNYNQLQSMLNLAQLSVIFD